MAETLEAEVVIPPEQNLPGNLLILPSIAFVNESEGSGDRLEPGVGKTSARGIWFCGGATRTKLPDPFRARNVEGSERSADDNSLDTS